MAYPDSFSQTFGERFFMMIIGRKDIRHVMMQWKLGSRKCNVKKKKISLLNYDILLRFDGSMLTYVVVTKDG